MAAQGNDTLYSERQGIPGSIVVDDIKKYIEDNLAQGYSVFPIWAEEGSPLTADNKQWSYGNGAIGDVGISVPEMEVFALSLQSLDAGTSVSIEILKNTQPVISQNFVGSNIYTTLDTPISFTEGEVINFRTDEVVGTYNNVRVTAWCRIPFLGLKGDKGDAASAVECMRILLAGQSDVNAASTVLNLGPVTINTTSATLSGNSINLPIGIYKITIEANVTSLAQRPNIGFNYYKDNALYSTRYGGNYIRRSSGHDEAGDSITDLIEYTSAGTFDIRAFQQGNAGTVNLLNTSRILIEKLQ